MNRSHRLPNPPKRPRGPSGAISTELQERIRVKLELSRTEMEVALALMDGHMRKTIARLRGCSVHTVDTHCRRIYAKLDVASAPAVVGKILAALVACQREAGETEED